MEEKQLRGLIKEKTVDGKLSCQDAHAIAEKFGIHLSQVGRICNEEESTIKISSCLLGCF